jgi:hypothetical protein
MTHRPCRVLCREEFADEPRSFDNWCTKNAEAYVNPSNNWYTQRCRNKAVGNSVGVAKLKEFCSVSLTRNSVATLTTRSSVAMHEEVEKVSEEKEEHTYSELQT